MQDEDAFSRGTGKTDHSFPRGFIEKEDLIEKDYLNR
jgi:hypothetical protein